MSRNQESYRSNRYGMERRDDKRSFVAVLCYIIFFAVTVSLSIALFVAYLAPLISPSAFGSLTIVGIFAPILYVMVFVCMLVWIILQRWNIVLALFVVLIPGLFSLSSFYNSNMHRATELPRDSRAFTVMSYNVRGFRGDNNEHTVSAIVDTLLRRERLPDVVCLQECALDAKNFARMDSLFRGYNIADATEYGKVVVRTYSRYPIISRGEISGEGRGTSQWCDVVIRSSNSRQEDTVRVFNNHLYTMNISKADSDDIGEGRILRDGDRMMSIVRRIADNSAIRVEHVDSLRQVIDATPHAMVVCGDFNDTPMSYVVRRLSRRLNDAFEGAGRGYGSTFRPMHSTLRIDYILHSDNVEVQCFNVDKDMYMSDHMPIEARLKVLKEE